MPPGLRAGLLFSLWRSVTMPFVMVVNPVRMLWWRAAGLGVGWAIGATGAMAQPTCTPLLNLTQPRLQDERPVNLCLYSGNVVLVVNTASYCGFTPQYKSLEALYERYRARGLVVLGFPSNDFGQQEPGSNKQIADFCENTFAVKFPMFAKSSVVGAGPGNGTPPNALFAALRQRTGIAPAWNFHKYLIGRDGETVISFGPKVDPADPAFLRDLDRLIATAAPGN